ncbi:MoaD/ThiS family protein [Waterburya agarophytonicola K14]|uniref:Molybdopterin synthase sulfur carrier subunit n=1 Tax=Waterburya agarophytonicola KI4 TaxID=2874699 RepID=A0A964BSR1_9CYAN|nr:MoaD/ThiS family protein [Waterburya agarophytonicola]MCC0177511.1 MoaD/ThiS family protein [Waterburya agarophytonicola KI4]
MIESKITIKVKLFAIYQEVLETSELDLVVPSETTVGDVLLSLIEQKPQLAKWQKVTRYGVNLQFVKPNTLLNDGDELVLIPPVSGG